jgi:hypothetical protein
VTAAEAAASKHDVAVELAAAVLAIQQCVGKDLAAQQPRIGAIEAQARTAFMNRRADWLELAGPVVADALALRPAGAVPGDDRELVPWFAGELGDQLSTDAAVALDAAVDLQVSRGQHPDVAWQRAVAGYGLAGTAMLGYINAALAAKPDGGTALLRVCREMAAKALLTQADRIGNREAAAWSTLPPVALAKAYDPQEARDERGRWATRDVKVTQREPAAPDAVDAALADAARRYADVPDDDTAAVNRYLNRYANRYAGNRYTAAQANRYTAVPTSENRYTNRYKPAQAPQETVTRLFLFGTVPPDKAPPPENVVDDDGFGLYLPMDKVKDYFWDTSRDVGTVHGRSYGTSMDFAVIADHLRNVRDDVEPIQLTERTSPWTGAGGVQNIDPDVWSKILPKAVRLWNDVQEEPVRAATQLRGELETVAERAGYPPGLRTAQILEKIETNYEMRENGVTRQRQKDGTYQYYNPGLLDALADYVVWNNPRSWGAEGVDLAGDLEYELNNAVDDTPVPEVISFGARLANDENGGDLHGSYVVTSVQYHSAIGAFGTSAPVGQIALREIHVRPEPEHP